MLSGFNDEKIVSIMGVRSLWGKRACREIISRSGDFIPLLVGVLDNAVSSPQSFISGENQTHIPAALLLAHVRATEAYPCLVNLISFGGSDTSVLWGSLLASHYPWMLRDTFNGEAFLLPKLIEDRSTSPQARAAAVKAWGMHYFDGCLSRQEIVGCFRRLIREVYIGESSQDDKTVLTCIAHCIREHQLEELVEDVKTVYARNCIDEVLCGDGNHYVSEFKNPRYKAEDIHIEDAIKVLEAYEWFKEKEGGTTMESVF